MKIKILIINLIFITMFSNSCKDEIPADLILINGKILTLDHNSSIEEAVAVRNGKIIAVGNNRQIKRFAFDNTMVINLDGRTVIPGIIDSHLHPESASLSELEEEIPDLHNIEQLLGWVKDQSGKKGKGSWIIMPKLFSTRLTEMRQPSLAELDQAAPDNPVFLNGSFGGMINSAAMRESGITRDTDHTGILKDEETGLPTGIIRASAFQLLKTPQKRQLTVQERKDALISMIARYNEYGITSLFSGAGDYQSIKLYQELAEKNELNARIYQNIILPTGKEITEQSVRDTLSRFNAITGSGNEWVRVGSLKVLLDGGILTGTAYLDEPWGEKAEEIFGIEDKTYKGVLIFSREQLLSIVKVANEFDWSFTIHATGGGAVEMILDVFDEVNSLKSIVQRRFSIIHGNFFSNETIRRMKELGVYANVQPAWFYKDADAMKAILGEERILSFHPYSTMLDKGIMINGGSDHMVKWDANTSINPYNPFLAIWTMVTRETERGSVILPSQAVTRYEALRIYTINNAFASFEESIKGTIEKGKLADMAVLSDDILSCHEDNIKEIRSVLTIVGGKIVFTSLSDL